MDVSIRVNTHPVGQPLYDAIRKLAQEAVLKPEGGFAVVTVLATLLGETIASAPIELQADMHVMAADKIDERVEALR